MLTMKKAFFSGMLTRHLLLNWEIANKKRGTVEPAYSQRLLSIVLLLGGMFMYLIGSCLYLRHVLTHESLLFAFIFLLSIFLGMVGSVMLGLSLVNYPPRMLLDDLQKLQQSCPGLSVYNTGGLSDWVTENLASRAANIKEAELKHGYDSAQTEALRASFKRTFQVFEKFHLTHENWKPYFEKADQMLAARKELAER